MNENPLLNRITVNPNIFGGKPIIRGMRIKVENVLALLEQDVTIEGILDDRHYWDDIAVHHPFDYVGVGVRHTLAVFFGNFVGVDVSAGTHRAAVFFIQVAALRHVEVGLKELLN